MTRGGGDLSLRTALVTGASSGIGAELARQLLQRGVGRVIGLARRADRLAALRQELGPRFEGRVADLCDPTALAAVAATTPVVDILINNAGAGWGGAFDSQARTDPARLLLMVDLNCRALLQGLTLWAPGMVDRGSGWILNVGSIAGLAPARTSAVYGPTKAFVNQLSEAVRMELRPHGVEVCLLTPGPVPSEFFDVARPGQPQPPRLLFVPTARVAAEALDDLYAGRARATPGRRTRLLAAALRAAPLPLLRRMSSSRAPRPRTGVPDV